MRAPTPAGDHHRGGDQGKESTMSIVRWSPFEELDMFERRMRRLLDGMGIVAAMPAADVYETDAEFVYEVEVPGFEEKELTVETSDHTLTIKGARAETKEKTEKTFRLQERLAKSFERRFELPPEADSSNLVADFKGGVLEVHAPKLKEVTPRTVAIGSKS
jgi:HSP20 family protein